MTAKAQRVLSELEGVCLGIIRAHQPCTAYRVRQELRQAPSSHWRASAGSVYPLLERLEGEGLLVARAAAADGRGKQLLSISRTGDASLRRWILAGTDMDLISSVSDPVRSRTFFLDALTAAQRARYIDALIERTEEYLAVTNSRLEKAKNSRNRFDYLGSMGAVKVTEARLDWLRTVRAELARKSA